MRLKKNRIFAILLTVVMCFTSVAPVAVFAEGQTARTIIAQENFDDKAVNTGASESAVLAADGFWFGNSNGSLYTMENGTLRYTDRHENDLTDIRFYYNTPEQAAAREMLKDDFTLSFRVKPLMNSLDMWVNWAQRNDGNGNIGTPVYEDGLRLSWGVLSGRGVYDRTKAEVPLNQWSVIEVYFEYEEGAVAYYTDKEGVQHETGEIGAFTSYTVSMNGMTMGTASVGSSHPLKNAYHCIDMFRLFQGATGNYELDDLTLITGAGAYNTNWDQSQEDYIANTKVFYEKPMVDASEYAYSLAIVGDTQVVCENDALYNQNGMDTLYQWIVDNAAAKNIQYVLGVGDITQHQKDAAEFALAKEAISKMNGVVPYSLARGNHDNSDPYNNTFNTDFYKSQFDGFYNNKLENAYKLMTLGETKYLFITLDYGPEDAVLEWAGNLCETYPDRKVIITTHAYLYSDGTTIDTGDSCDPITMNKRENNGETIWEKLGKKHENIFMIISGHECSDRVLVTEAEGENGNIVTQMLVDFQGVDASYGYGSTGMITMLYFSKDGKSVTVETYSTILEKHFREENQFSFRIPDDSLNNIYSNDFENCSTEDISTNVGGTVVLGAENCGHTVADGVLNITKTNSGYVSLRPAQGNSAYKADGATPIKGDVTLSFDIKVNNSTDEIGALYCGNETASKKGETLKFMSVASGKVSGFGKDASIKIGEWNTIKVVFNYDAANGRFSSYTVILNGEELHTNKISTDVTLTSINMFTLFRWGDNNVSFALDNLSYDFGKDIRGAGNATELWGVDFEGVTELPTSAARLNNMRVMNNYLPATNAKAKSRVANGILTLSSGGGQAFIDLNPDKDFGYVGDMTLTMKLRATNTNKDGGNVVAVYYDNANIEAVKFASQNQIKLNKSGAVVADISLYRFTTVEVMFHYDYASATYASISLYVDGEFVDSMSVSGWSQIKWFRALYVSASTVGLGVETDEIHLTKNCKSLYAGETAVTEFIGYQTTAVENNAFNLRLLSVMTDSDLSKYDYVGYNVVARYTLGGVEKTMTLSAEDGRCYKVFTSVLATDEMAVANELTAATLGGEYIIALNCVGLPTNCDIQFTVSTYYALEGQEEVTEREFTFTVNSSAIAN